MEQIAGRLRTFLFEEKAAPQPEPTGLQLRLCGYSAGRPLAEVWEVSMTGRGCPPPRRVMEEAAFGVLWDGQYEALNRLILGLGLDVGDALVRHGVPPRQAGGLRGRGRCACPLESPSTNIPCAMNGLAQDAPWRWRGSCDVDGG